jgi:hypothetical protein
MLSLVSTLLEPRWHLLHLLEGKIPWTSHESPQLPRLKDENFPMLVRYYAYTFNWLSSQQAKPRDGRHPCRCRRTSLSNSQRCHMPLFLILPRCIHQPNGRSRVQFHEAAKQYVEWPC